MEKGLGDEREWKLEHKLNSYRLSQDRERPLSLKPMKKIQKYLQVMEESEEAAS